ncbi:MULTISPECIES: DUF2304 domain-containing protein [Pseudoalteromonas]|uniref:DUF2304 domain-containing protein n=1 Tax=Pseudoalteromonas TaxID=53246 RepID=UPI001582DA3E|nr:MULTISPECIES: DUF2304 domain-containing protein [Pseudoalteromonas]MDI4652851.1 DUF2304 domain-containing protein [Pseudoalteromonas shioyasakiensis]NUJ39640.1 DUF2304 domain-containing protein [Pseudoalteromonas sp. 0303]
MELYHYFTAITAVLFFIFVVLLIRRDSILMGAAFRWLVLAIAILVLGVFPKTSDILAGWFGISYSPILPVILACLLLMLKALIADIERAKNQVKLDRIAQRLAIVEVELNELKKETK